jgi:hypothetical protein
MELDRGCIRELGDGKMLFGFRELSDRVVRAEEVRTIRMSGSPGCSRSDSVDGSRAHAILIDRLTRQREAFMMGRIVWWRIGRHGGKGLFLSLVNEALNFTIQGVAPMVCLKEDLRICSSQNAIPTAEFLLFAQVYLSYTGDGVPRTTAVARLMTPTLPRHLQLRSCHQRGNNRSKAVVLHLWPERRTPGWNRSLPLCLSGLLSPFSPP